MQNSSSTHPNAHQNRLLASLSPKDYEQLRPHLEPVTLQYKRSLYEANRPIDFIYFIETGVGSLVLTMANGDAAEVGTIDNEGLVGLPAVLDDSQAPNSVYMQVAGEGLRTSAKTFRHQMDQSPPLRTAIRHYSHAFFNQVAQSAACNAFHNLEQRCCRWLLMTHDRMQSDEFPLTQEFLAMMLGVRRASVTLAASALQRSGLIKYTRGHVTVLDHAGLRKRSCECYGISKREFDRLLGAAS
jgi:CRP-like cAMP-binding protein